MTWNGIKSILKIFKNIFSFKVVKTNTKKENLEKPTKEKLLFLIPENVGDRVLSVCKTKIPTESIEKGIMCFKKYQKVFQVYQLFKLTVNPTHSF